MFPPSSSSASSEWHVVDSTYAAPFIPFHICMMHSLSSADDTKLDALLLPTTDDASGRRGLHKMADKEVSRGCGIQI